MGKGGEKCKQTQLFRGLKAKTEKKNLSRYEKSDKILVTGSGENKYKTGLKCLTI